MSQVPSEGPHLEMKELDELFLGLLDLLSRPAPLGQLANAARATGSVRAARSARLWVASARSRGLVDVEIGSEGTLVTLL